MAVAYIKLRRLPPEREKIIKKLVALSPRVKRQNDHWIQYVLDKKYDLYSAKKDRSDPFEKALKLTNFAVQIGHLTFLPPKAGSLVEKMKEAVCQAVATHGLIDPYSRIFYSLGVDSRARFFNVVHCLSLCDPAVGGPALSGSLRSIFGMALEDASKKVEVLSNGITFIRGHHEKFNGYAKWVLQTLGIPFEEKKENLPKWVKPAVKRTEIKMLPYCPTRTPLALNSSTEMLHRIHYFAYAALLSLEALCEKKMSRASKRELPNYEAFYGQLEQVIEFIDLWNATWEMKIYRGVGHDPVYIPTHLNRRVWEIFIEAERLSFPPLSDLL